MVISNFTIDISQINSKSTDVEDYQKSKDPFYGITEPARGILGNSRIEVKSNKDKDNKLKNHFKYETVEWDEFVISSIDTDVVFSTNKDDKDNGSKEASSTNNVRSPVHVSTITDRSSG